MNSPTIDFNLGDMVLSWLKSSEAGWSNHSHLVIRGDGPVCQGKAPAFPPELIFPVLIKVEIPPPPFPTMGVYELMGNQDYPSPTYR